MKNLAFLLKIYLPILLFLLPAAANSQSQISPENIRFVRQGARRLIFDENQFIPLFSLNPGEIIGVDAMHPHTCFSEDEPEILLDSDKLIVRSEKKTATAIWFGGFNPFATYIIELDELSGNGEVGFEFSNIEKTKRFIITAEFDNDKLVDVRLNITSNSNVVFEESIRVNSESDVRLKGKIICQMLGSGLTMYHQNKGIPVVIGQSNFNRHLDLRKKTVINSFQSNLYVQLTKGFASVSKIEAVISTGIGLADIRAITYENGDPMVDNGRLWYTMSVRGRALPHHIQGVFSMNPTVFDIRLEGIIVFDRADGILRNEIASHIFYDRQEKIWRGLTTGFSAFANPEKEEKQLLAVESKRDPRFGFSVMHAEPFGVVGDIEDPHIIYDADAEKWRILTCENKNGYKAILLESDNWNKGYKKVAGPVKHNSTGTSMMKIGEKRFCFSGSSEREIFIYSYPDLKEIGTLNIDLPPWSENSRTRVWPNIVQLPEGFPFRYVALMMDRFNFPGLQGPNWSYGALYLYHGFE